MPYCRKCGASLQDYNRFCPKCGTQVINYLPVPSAPALPPKPMLKDPYVLAAIGLVIIVLLAGIIVVFLFAPFASWSVGQTMRDSGAGVNTLNLNFNTDVGGVNVMTQKIPNANLLIYVSANGSRGLLGGGSDEPVTISFDNQTVGDVLTVNCDVSTNLFSLQSNVVCQILVDPALNLNLNITSGTGQVSFTADKPTIIQALNLHTNIGGVQANLANNVTVAGDISLKTNTGAVYYRMSETNFEGNNTLDLHSNVGSVNMDITQTKTLDGNLQVNAATDTGSINLALNIDGGVAAKITSQTRSLDNIKVDVKSFSGNKSPIQSNNYPAASNIEIHNFISGFGSVNIRAIYQTMVIPA